MENKIKIAASVLVVLLIGLTTFLLIESFKSLPDVDYEKVETNTPKPQKISMANPVSTEKRKSITFIFGDDKKAENRYYWEATNYYRNAPEARTDFLVTHCRSLLEARNYLEENAISGKPWGKVNMVVHSNEWSGMEVPVIPEGNRATVQSVRSAIDGGLFHPLSKHIADINTIISVYGCALGKNDNLIQVLNQAFFGKGNKMEDNLTASPYFILYESKLIDGTPVSNKYHADAYYAFYKRGYRPGDIKLSQQLDSRYPSTNVDWRKALENKTPGISKDPYHYTFHLPIVWTVTYPDKASRPELKTQAEKEAWISSQPELMEAIRELGISKDLFTWTIRKINYTFDDGVTEPGIKVIGFCTVLTVLDIVEEEREELVQG